MKNIKNSSTKSITIVPTRCEEAQNAQQCILFLGDAYLAQWTNLQKQNPIFTWEHCTPARHREHCTRAVSKQIARVSHALDILLLGF